MNERWRVARNKAEGIGWGQVKKQFVGCLGGWFSLLSL